MSRFFLLIDILKGYKFNLILNFLESKSPDSYLDRRGGVEIERSPRIREIRFRSPVATDLSRKNR